MSKPEGPKSKTIPSRQLQDSIEQPESAKDSHGQSSDEENHPDRKPLLEQAAKFLDNEDIKDASPRKKRSFLESKGLDEEEVGRLLQQKEQEKSVAPEAEVMDYGIEKEIAEMESSRESTAHVQPTPTSPSSPNTIPKDTPPIITYPEFLIYSQKPQPLITAKGLLTAFYVASSVFAATYGLGKYIIEPMVDNLTAARCSLAETATANLETLNSKLEGAVSKMPDTSKVANAEEGSVVESVDSDAARFFSRSAGTQTYPPHSRATSLTSTSSITPPIEQHEGALSTIHSRLSELVPTNAESNSPVKDSIDGLRKYLERLPHANATQSEKLWDKPKVDEYARLKTDIRAVKGVLLSARNFPSGVAAR